MTRSRDAVLGETPQETAEFDPTSVLFTLEFTSDAVSGEALGRSVCEPSPCDGEGPCDTCGG